MNKTSRALMIGLIACIVVCVLITVWAVFFRGDDPISPDYPPQGFEDGQTPIEGDDGAKIESPSGGGAIRVTLGTTATASISSGKVSLYYANPGASNQNVQIFVIITDKNSGNELVVAKSDLITPGNQVNELDFEEYAKKHLGEGGYNAELVIKAFDPESNEKAMVDTRVELTLTVVK